MTWAEITAWNIGKRLETTGILTYVWFRLIGESWAEVLEGDDKASLEALGYPKWEYWVRRGAEDARAEAAKA